MNDDIALSRRILLVDVAALKVHPKNIQIYGNEPIDRALLQSIKDIGIDSPLEITTEYIVIKGHRRLQHARHLKMKQVPCVMREDLKDDLSILFSLIEDNRHQRSRSVLQKQKETEELAEIIRARRLAMTRPNDRKGALKNGTINSEAAANMPRDEAESLDAQIEEAQKNLSGSKKYGRSIDIAMQVTGISASSYERAKRVNKAIRLLMEQDREIEAVRLKRLVTERSLAAAVRQASTVLGINDETAKGHTKKSPARRTIKQQASMCLSELKRLKQRVGNEQVQINTALRCIEAFYSNLGDQEDAEAKDRSVSGGRSGEVRSDGGSSLL